MFLCRQYVRKAASNLVVRRADGSKRQNKQQQIRRIMWYSARSLKELKDRDAKLLTAACNVSLALVAEAQGG